jgi:hypothetical protein
MLGYDFETALPSDLPSLAAVDSVTFTPRDASSEDDVIALQQRVERERLTYQGN